MYGHDAGKVLVSFNFFENDSPNFLRSIAPKSVKHYIKIKLLGLRNLRSFGLLPVTKAFVKFDINSIRRPEDLSSNKNKAEIITQPKEAGPNPNIQSIVAFDVLLPEDIAYMPVL